MIRKKKAVAPAPAPPPSRSQEQTGDEAISGRLLLSLTGLLNQSSAGLQRHLDSGLGAVDAKLDAILAELRRLGR